MAQGVVLTLGCVLGLGSVGATTHVVNFPISPGPLYRAYAEALRERV